jgi:CBS-domain-containing membrane protein
MNEQRQHPSVQHGLPAGTAGTDPAASAERLARARAELDDVYAAADAILDGIRHDDNERFLEQARQSGGQ